MFYFYINIHLNKKIEIYFTSKLNIISSNILSLRIINTMSCIICCEDFKAKSPSICCMYCEFEACRICCEKYILSEEIPKCMRPECGKEWSRKFLREKFTNIFLTNKFKEHIEGILFDREKALLPATQPLVEEKIRKKNIKKQMSDIDILINDLVRQKKILENEYYVRPLKKQNEEKSHGFVRQCPADGCRGFLSTQWKCGLCEKWTCPECHEFKGDNRDSPHTCDPNSVETAKMLKKDSKPCPKCQCLIFKVSGCDQMWCTQCRTAFNWSNGNIVHNNIHNPHYHEWMRMNNTRAAQPIAQAVGGHCGLNMLNHNVSNTIMDAAVKLGLYEKTPNAPRKYYSRPNFDPRIDLICDIIRCNMHNVDVEMPHFQTDYFEKNVDLRIKYLENLITEEEFKILIQRNDKKSRKNTEISQIIQLSNTTITDIVFRIIDHLQKCIKNGISLNLETFIAEFGEIQKYCNNILRDIAFTYNSSQYNFDNNFEFKNIGKFEKEIKVKEIKKDESVDEKIVLKAKKKVIVIDDDEA